MAKNPQILENYEIGDLIGKGRFAEVFRAVKRDLGREVALKILLPAWNENAAVRSQFMEQAKLIARLRHPRIVEAMDLGEENGRLFMAMEYLPKGDLHQWLQSFGKKRPSLLQVVILVEDIAKALDFIHSQTESGGTLVHGDVKPGNILLTEERDTPGRLRAKLSDLGLLTVLQKAASMSGSSAFPQSSPLYISPEQADDNSPTPFSDQYALGVVTYELLTGQPPFVGGSDVTIYRHHKQTQPQPPSAHVSQLQREIDEVLLKVLAKDPAMRYPNCTSFARALRQAVEVAEQKRFANLLAQAREALAEGQPEKALPALEEARQIKPDDSEVKNLFEQAQKTALAARNYQEAGELLDSARAEAQKLRAETPDYSDSQKLLATFAPRPLDWWEVFFHRWKRALWSAGVVLLFILLVILVQGDPWVATAANTPVFQTMVGNFWTASPTHTPTNTHTSTPTNTSTPTSTLTPTFTPSPIAFATSNVTDMILLRRLSGLENAGYVNSVAFSPSSDLIAAGSDDGMLRIWNTGDPQFMKQIDIGSAIKKITFSPNGEWLIAGSVNFNAYVWRTKDWILIQSLSGHTNIVKTISISVDGYIATGSFNSIQIWLSDGENINNIKTLNVSGTVSEVAFSPDGEFLAVGVSGVRGSVIYIYPTNDWDHPYMLDVPGVAYTLSYEVTNLSFSLAGALEACIIYNTPAGFSNAYKIVTWDIESSAYISFIDTEFPTCYPPTYLTENLDLIASNQTINISTKNGSVLHQLVGHGSNITDIALSPKKVWLASSSYNEVFLWGVPRWDTIGTPTLVPTRTTTPTPTSTP